MAPPPFPGKKFYQKDHPKGGQNNSSLNDKIAKEGLMLTDNEWKTVNDECCREYLASLYDTYGVETFKSTDAKRALMDAVATIRTNIQEIDSAIYDRWVEHVDPVSPQWVVNTLKYIVLRAQSNKKRVAKAVSKTDSPPRARPIRLDSIPPALEHQPLPGGGPKYFDVNCSIFVDWEPFVKDYHFEDVLSQYLLSEYKKAPPLNLMPHHFDYTALVTTLQDEGIYNPATDTMFSYHTEQDKAAGVNRVTCKSMRNFRFALSKMVGTDVRFYVAATEGFEELGSTNSNLPLAQTKEPRRNPPILFKATSIRVSGSENRAPQESGDVGSSTRKDSQHPSDKAQPVSLEQVYQQCLSTQTVMSKGPLATLPTDQNQSTASKDPVPGTGSNSGGDDATRRDESRNTTPPVSQHHGHNDDNMEDGNYNLSDDEPRSQPNLNPLGNRSVTDSDDSNIPDPISRNPPSVSDDEPKLPSQNRQRNKRKRLHDPNTSDGDSNDSPGVGKTSPVIESSFLESDVEEIQGLNAAPEIIDEKTLAEDEDARERRIQQLSIAPSLIQLTEPGWDECASFFRFPKANKGRDHTMWVPRLKLPLYPHQIHCVYWMLSVTLRNEYLHGGFLADEVGVGKTFELLAYWVMNALLSNMWRRVKACRSSSDPKDRKKHLARGTARSPQPKNPICPTARKFPIECPCVEGSISHKLAKAARPGPGLGIVPPQLIHQWKAEALKLIDFEGTYVRDDGYEDHSGLGKLHLFIGHGSDQTPVDPFVTNNLRAKVVRKPRFQDPGSYEETTWEPHPGSEKILVLSTPQSLHNKVLLPYSVALESYWTARNVPRQKTQFEERRTHAQVWGIMFRDEFHKDKGKGTKISEYFKQPYLYQLKDTPYHPLLPIKWAVSGTPFDTTPLDLLSHIQALEFEEWSEPNHPLGVQTEDSLRELVKAWDTIVPKDSTVRTADAKTIKRYARQLNRFLEPIMIRRMGYDMFWGEPVVKLPKCKVIHHPFKTPLEYKDVIDKIAQEAENELEGEYQKRLARWRSGPRSTDEPQRKTPRTSVGIKYFQYRVCGTFPAYAGLRSQYDGWSFRKEDLDREGLLLSKEKLEASPYYTELDALTANSPKIRWIRKYLERLHITNEAIKRQNIEAAQLYKNKPLGKRREPKSGDISKPTIIQPEKVVLLSNTPAIALVLSLWINKELPEIGAVLYHQKLSLESRNQLIKDWSNDEEPDDKNAAPLATVLVSTLALAGVGLNLTAANHCIISDLAFTTGSQTQGFGRVHRTGQLRDTHCHLLWTTDNVPEANIKARQDGRADVHDQTWSVKALENRNADEEDRRRQMERNRLQRRRNLTEDVV